MSKQSEEARAASKSKAERLVRADPRARVDASGYTPADALNGDVATGMRPVSRRAYRRGGKVDGAEAPKRADRKPRKSGGALTADSLMNRDQKEANKERGGEQFTGGMKRGGRAHKTMGGLALPNAFTPVARKAGGRTGKVVGGPIGNEFDANRLLAQTAGRAPSRPVPARPGPANRPVGRDPYNSLKSIAPRRAAGGRTHGKDCSCAKCGGGRVGRKAGGAINDGTRPVAGRLARKGGGRTKGTNVNIIIAPSPGAGAPAMPPRPMPMPPPGGAGLHQGLPPPPPPGMPPAGAPPPMAMGRKAGGRVGEGFGGTLAKPGSYPIKDGSGGGKGRMEKAKAYG